MRYKKQEVKASCFLLPQMTLLLCFFISLGIIRIQFLEEKEKILCDVSCEVVGTIIDQPEEKDLYQIFTIRTSNNDHYDVRIRAPLYPRYRVGDMLSLSGKVSAPSSFVHETTSFDYERYLRLKSVGSEMFYPAIKYLDHQNNFMVELKTLRGTLLLLLEKHLTHPAAYLVSGMLFGATSFPKDLGDVFRATGISHIIVLSGFNITLLITSILFLLRMTPLIVRVLTTVFFVLMFVVMVGAEASSIRATIMAFISLLALTLGRGYLAKQALMLSLGVMVLIAPEHLLYDTSLHLSFLATAGIVYLVPYFEKLFAGLHGSYREMFITTLAAYIGTMPYLMYTFGAVSLYALLANMLVLPLVPALMMGGFLVVLFSKTIPLGAAIIGYLTSALSDLLIFIAQVISSLPSASLKVSLSFFGMISTYGLSILIVCFMVKYQTRKHNETLLTKQNELLSEVITYS